MKSLYYIGFLGIIIFEILNVYFIMPMPGSQEMNSLGTAFYLYSYRWFFRGVFGLMILSGLKLVFLGKRKWIPVLPLVVVALVVYLFNFKMVADKMFLQPQNPVYSLAAENKIPADALVIGVEINGEAKAYPIRFLTYHHQVIDTVGGKVIMVTYCSVCRTGRVFEPIVNGKPENFRLVGMDHFNAMIEDETTNSWWRQATGEAVIGQLKGSHLPEVPAEQFSLSAWLALHPDSKIMQADSYSTAHYDTGSYEQGKSQGHLTGTDSASWHRKSWVVGVIVGQTAKAYDWNRLKKERFISDNIEHKPIVVILAKDNTSFVVFYQPAKESLTLKNDSLFSGETAYSLSGNGLNGAKLQKVAAYQEFWHSWKTFHPATLRY